MKAFIFDLDGTLSDSVPLIINTATQAFAQLGVHPGAEKLRSYIGFSLFETGEALLGPGRGQEYVERYEDIYFRNSHTLEAFPGALDMLRALRQAGAKTALCTAKRKRAAIDSLEQIGAAELMDAVVYSELTERHKPFPDPALKAAELLQMPVADCLFIGDAKHDIGCAKQAGMQVCAVSWGAGSSAAIADAAPDYLVDSMQELEKLLLSLIDK